MPRRLLVIGGFFCLIGGVALIRMGVVMLRLRGINVDVTVFWLPVGLGLLRAKPSSRRWAVFWAALTILIAGASAAFILFSGNDVTANAFGAAMRGPVAMAYVVGLALALIAGCALVIWTLYTPPVSSAFSTAESRETAPEERFEADPGPVAPPTLPV